MTHTHSDGGAQAGWFAANFMLVMVLLVVAILIIAGAVLWRPWDGGTSGEGGGSTIDINVGEGGGDGGGDGESSNYRIVPDRVVAYS